MILVTQCKYYVDTKRVPEDTFGVARNAQIFNMRVTIPKDLQLDVDTETMERAAGRAAVRLIKRRLKAGEDGDGAPAHMPLDGTPFANSGRLISHVRYHRKQGIVAPMWQRKRGDAGERGLGDRGATSYSVAAIHIASGLWRDPMGSTSAEQSQRLVGEAVADLRKQAARRNLVKAKGPRMKR